MKQFAIVVCALTMFAARVSPAGAQTKIVRNETDGELTFGGAVRKIGQKLDATAVAFSPDSKELAIAFPGSLWVGDPVTGQNTDEVKNLPTIRQLCYSPDGKRIAAAADDKTVRIFDAKTHKVTATLNVATTRDYPIQHATQLAFSPDGKILAVIDADQFLTLWTADRGQLKGRYGNEDASGRQMVPRSLFITGVMFSPDGKQLATLVRGPIELSKTASVEIIWRGLNGRFEPGPFSYGQLKSNPAVFASSVSLEANAFVSMTQSADGRFAAWSGHAGAMLVFDLKTKKLLDKLKSQEEHCVLGFSADNSRLITVRGRDQVSVFHVPQQRLLGLVNLDETAGRPPLCVALSSDGKLLAAGGNGAGIGVYDLSLLKDDPESTVSPFPVKNNKPLKPGVRLDFDGFSHLSTPTLSFLSPERVLAIAASPDGKTVAAGTEGKAVLLFDPATGKQTAALDGHKDSVTRIKYSPKGNRLVTGSIDGTHVIWDLDAGKSMAKISISAAPGSERVNCANQLAVAPDGGRLAIVTRKGVSLWDLVAAKPLGVIATEPAPDGTQPPPPMPKAGANQIQNSPYTPYTQSVGELAFAPDGTMATIASSAKGTDWELGWRNAKGAAVAPPFGAGTSLQYRNGYALMPNLVFSLDGNSLGVMSRNHCNVYDLRNKKLELETGSSQFDGRFVGFSGDGDKVLFTDNYHQDDFSRKVVIYSRKSKRHFMTIDFGQGVKADSVALSANGRWMVVADTYRIRLWDIDAL